MLITDDSISPKAVRLKEGQLVAWISYSATPVTIVFEREVARSMICHSLVNFSIVEDELRSEPIHPGEFASFCELKPGRYQYIIKRPGQALANPQHQGQDRDPRRDPGRRPSRRSSSTSSRAALNRRPRRP